VTDGRPVFLIGFMGSGKSAVGQALAGRLGWSFVDTDEQVEQRAGRSIAEIFANSGESAFRELEWQVLCEVGERMRCVVATGGGLFLRAAARRRMGSRGRTVWLDCPLAVVQARVGAGVGRPLWDATDPLAQRALFERRRAVYALARYRVDASVGPPEAVAAAVERAVFH